MRHPQPLTPSDLHSMLEKEQEAIVSTTGHHQMKSSLPSGANMKLSTGKPSVKRTLLNSSTNSLRSINHIVDFCYSERRTASFAAVCFQLYAAGTAPLFIQSEFFIYPSCSRIKSRHHNFTRYGSAISTPRPESTAVSQLSPAPGNEVTSTVIFTTPRRQLPAPGFILSVPAGSIPNQCHFSTGGDCTQPRRARINQAGK